MVVKHGTSSRYRNDGCRCEACRKANSAATQDWRERNRAHDNALAREREQAKDELARRHYAEYREILTAIRAGEVVEVDA